MPREIYQIVQQPEIESMIVELNRILADISTRLNFITADGSNTSFSGMKIIDVAPAVSDTDVPILDQIAVTSEDLTSNRIVQTNNSTELSSVEVLTAWITQFSANQVIVEDIGEGKLRLKLPQNIDTNADVEFDSLTLNDLTTLQVISADAAKKLISTGVTAVDLVSLTDDSIVDDLHRHSELSGSDGTPNPALSLDADGNVSVTVSLRLVLDNIKAMWGTGNDASIYYDGTDLNIKSDEVAPSDINITCGANKTLELQNVVYEDLQVSISNIKVPTSNAPTERLYDGGTGGVTFPFLGFAVNEYIYFDVQTTHSMKLNTILDNHIHFSLPNTTDIGDRFQFQLDVMAAGIDTAWAVPAGSPFTAEHTIVANDDTYQRLMEVADIDASNDTVSSVYKCKLTRIAATTDEYGSEVYITFTDCHYQVNTMGSRQENSK